MRAQQSVCLTVLVVPPAGNRRARPAPTLAAFRDRVADEVAANPFPKNWTKENS
jgi:hypothetical protein